MIEIIIAVICMGLSDRYAHSGDKGLIKKIKILRVLSIIALVYSGFGTAFFLIYGLAMGISSAPYVLDGYGPAFLTGGASIIIVCCGFSLIPGLVLSIISIVKSTKALKIGKNIQNHIERVHEELHAYCVDCGNLWYSGNMCCSNCGGRDYMVR